VTSRVFWHGGQSGLARGGQILPPSTTGATRTLYETAQAAGLAAPARRDRVYVTTSYDAALIYAALHPSGGAVYLVEPEGEMVPDPDCVTPGLSWECESARIVRPLPVPEEERAVVMQVLLAGGAP